MLVLRSVCAFASLACIALASHAQQPAPAPTQPNPPVTPATSERAGDILARVRPAVIQIKGFFGSNTAHAFHGTGFAVAPGGIFMTNYHVVSQKVLYPDKYRLEYRAAEGKTGAVNVLAIDVRHDLAVVQAVGLAPSPLKLESAVPSKGDRAYSIGFPLDVGLTITEGVSNGKVEDSFDPRIHYSGAINGGMSGGPALNATGVVIGVNVSAYLFKQLVSFLVPAEHAQVLLDHALQAKPVPGGLRKGLVEQLHGHSVDLLDALKGPMSTQVASGYTLPARLAPFINCSGAGEPVTDQPFDAVIISCSASAGLFVQPGLYAGNLKYTHFVLTTEKLDAWRFARRLTATASSSGNYGSRRHVGPFACEDQVLRLKGFDAAVLVCVRSYRVLQGLYDFTVRVSSLNGAKRGFASHLDMFGLEFDAGMQFIRRYVEAMEWKT
jgi:serine protease Do